jgi:Methyltransferase small domain
MPGELREDLSVSDGANASETPVVAPAAERATSHNGRRPLDELGLLDRNYSAGVLARALARKLRRKIFGLPPEIEPAYRFGYVIFDRPDLDGGGPGFGQDYIRALEEIGLRHCGRLFEFCAGPGYIGYSLMARGVCGSLALADVNPVAVEAARKTAGFNGIEDRVSIYLSDGFDQIPASEKWDLVVGNPPHFLRWTGPSRLRCEDPDWELHKRFYSQVKRFLNPGARVLLQENGLGSNVEMFIPMIREGGGAYLGTLPGPDIGAGGKMYYILSRWD